MATRPKAPSVPITGPPALPPAETEGNSYITVQQWLILIALLDLSLDADCEQKRMEAQIAWDAKLRSVQPEIQCAVEGRAHFHGSADSLPHVLENQRSVPPYGYEAKQRSWQCEETSRCPL